MGTLCKGNILLLTFPYSVIANDDYLFKTCFKSFYPEEFLPRRESFFPEILIQLIDAIFSISIHILEITLGTRIWGESTILPEFMCFFLMN